MGQQRQQHWGLTGGIASGKSTVAQLFTELGAEVIDADEVYRWCVRPGSAGLASLVAEFGPQVCSSDGSLDRAVLAEIVFADPQARQRLNALTHPLVREESARRVAASDAEVVIEDIPLLVETNQTGRFDRVIVVQAPVAQRIQRMVSQRGMTAQQAQARIAAQASDAERAQVADSVIVNDGDLAQLRAKVEEFWASVMG